MIERLTAVEARAAIPELAELLRDAVDGGASVSFLPPLNDADARAYWHGAADAVARESRILLVARDARGIVGTVQLDLDQPPNGRHRAEVIKLLVHSRARRQGLGRALLSAIEAEACRAGCSLLVLDTLQGDAGESLYRTCGYTEAGVIPCFARGADGALHATVFFYRILTGIAEA